MNASKKPTRGGRREGSGRKPLGKGRYTLTLTESTVETVKGRTANFSGLVDDLLTKWLETHAA